jgi:hypothetical protein
MVDILWAASLPYFMRWTVLIALTFLLSVVARAQEAAQDRSSQPRDQLPATTAEPDNIQAYAPAEPIEEEGPTEADRGPAQRPFILATGIDTLDTEENPPRVGNLPAEKLALDPKVKVLVIHDVQNDSTYKGASNHALLYEIKYINWGAVTAGQLEARRGHYFTISWVNHGPRADFTAQFQYREVKSREVVRTLVQAMPEVKGTVRSYFGVVGKAYKTYGPVASWRFSILRDGKVVAQTKSYVW